MLYSILDLKRNDIMNPKKLVNNTTFQLFSSVLLSLAISSPAIAGWQLEWIDDFEGTRVNKTNWTSQVQANFNNELQCYTDDDTSANKNYDVSNGTLKIISRRQSNSCAGLNGTSKSWTSGRINTKDKQEFLYGRIESRIRLNDTRAGSWPAFWMLENRINEHPIANDNDTVGWPNPGAGEIDIWEWYANSPNSYITNFFNKSDCGSAVRYNYPNGSADVLQWHTYAMEWDKDAITFYMDDIPVATQNISSCAQYKEPMFVLLNVAMGGDLGGVIDSTLNSVTMEVDYVAHCSATNDNSQTQCKPSSQASQTAPVITSTAINSVISGNAYDYTLTATDADTLTLSATVLPNWLSFDSDTGRLSGTPSVSDAGLHEVTLTVSDGTELTTQSFAITVFSSGSTSDNGSGGGSIDFLLIMLSGLLLMGPMLKSFRRGN